MPVLTIRHAEALDGHRLSLKWSDGLEGIADLTQTLKHPAYAPLRDEARFRDVRIEDYGFTVYWVDPDGEEIDICPDMLRAMVDPTAAAKIADEERRWHETRDAAE